VHGAIWRAAYADARQSAWFTRAFNPQVGSMLQRSGCQEDGVGIKLP